MDDKNILKTRCNLESGSSVGYTEEPVKIEGRVVDRDANFLDPVIYVPAHAKGNASHEDCEQGVIITPFDNKAIRVLYCRSRKVQMTNPKNLVWG